MGRGHLEAKCHSTGPHTFNFHSKTAKSKSCQETFSQLKHWYRNFIERFMLGKWDKVQLMLPGDQRWPNRENSHSPGFIPIPRIPKYLVNLQISPKNYIAIPTHSNGTIDIPMRCPKSKKFQGIQGINIMLSERKYKIQFFCVFDYYYILLK